MKQFVKQTLTKINQLISKGTEALRSEICQSQSEIKSLKMKLLEMTVSKEVPENTVERTPGTEEEEEWTEGSLSPEFAEDFQVCYILHVYMGLTLSVRMRLLLLLSLNPRTDCYCRCTLGCCSATEL